MSEKFSKLLDAIADGDTEQVSMLLVDGVRVERASSDEYSPILIAARHGDVDIVKLLVGWGSSLKRPEDRKYGPLHIASSFGKADVVLELLGLGADPQELTQDGKTSLELAQKYCHQGVVGILKAKQTSASVALAGAPGDVAMHPEQGGAYANLIEAVKAENPQAVWHFLESGVNPNDPVFRGNNPEYPLAWAVKRGNAIIVRLLLKNGATPGSIPRRPVLLDAVMYDDLLVAKELLEAGADPNAGNPLWFARNHLFNKPMIMLLLKHGTNPKRGVCVAGVWYFRQLFAHGLALRDAMAVDVLIAICCGLEDAGSNTVGLLDLFLSHGMDASFSVDPGEDSLYPESLRGHETLRQGPVLGVDLALLANNTRVAKRLLSKGARPKSLFHSLLDALTVPSLQVIQIILDTDNFFMTLTAVEWNEVYRYAIERRTEAALSILEDFFPSFDYSPLHDAIYYKNHDAARLLLGLGFSAEDSTLVVKTPAYRVLTIGTAELVTLFQEVDAIGDEAKVRALGDVSGVRVEELLNLGVSPSLMGQATFLRVAEARVLSPIRRYVESGGDINIDLRRSGSESITLFGIALLEGWSQLLDYILSLDDRPLLGEAQQYASFPPLVSREALEKVQAKTGDLRSLRDHVFAEAVVSDDPTLVEQLRLSGDDLELRMLLKSPYLRFGDKEMFYPSATLFGLAATQGKVNLVKYLLAKGAKVRNLSAHPYMAEVFEASFFEDETDANAEIRNLLVQHLENEF